MAKKAMAKKKTLGEKTSAKKPSAKKPSAKKIAAKPKPAAKRGAKPAEKIAAKSSAKPARPGSAESQKKSSVQSSEVSGKTAMTYQLSAGDKAPTFVLEATGGEKVDLASFKGQAYVIYFYPKDNTPGCTLEGHDFAKLYAKFKAAGCEVFGVSRDSLKSHESFKAKCGFPFALLTDPEGAACGAFDVIQMKSLYGRKFEGIERSTFVVDKSGVVRGEWRKVRVGGHAAEVLAFVENLS